MALGFSNGQSKMPMIGLDAVVRSVLCDDHNLQLNVCVRINANIASFMIVSTCSSPPLNAEERAGIVVQVLVKTLIEKELDTSFEDETEAEAVKVKDREGRVSEAEMLDMKEMRVCYCYALTSSC